MTNVEWTSKYICMYFLEIKSRKFTGSLLVCASLNFQVFSKIYDLEVGVYLTYLKPPKCLELPLCIDYFHRICALQFRVIFANNWLDEDNIIY